MAKKSTGARQPNAARRSQSNAKATAVRLVRQPGTGEDSVSAGTPVMTRPTQSTPARPMATKPAAKPAPRVGASARPQAASGRATMPTSSAASAAKAAPAASAPATRGQAERAQAAKVARAREIQRARAANLITPEHYDYVIKDLKLIGILAACMFTIEIVLHFAMK